MTILVFARGVGGKDELRRPKGLCAAAGLSDDHRSERTNLNSRRNAPITLVLLFLLLNIAVFTLAVPEMVADITIADTARSASSSGVLGSPLQLERSLAWDPARWRYPFSQNRRLVSAQAELPSW